MKQSISAAELNAQSKLTLVSNDSYKANEQSGGRLATKSHRESTVPEGGYPKERTTRAREACYHYVTRTVKGTRCLPDGTWERYTYTETVRVPFIPPRAESTRTRKATVSTVVKTGLTRDDHRRILATVSTGIDLNEQ